MNEWISVTRRCLPKSCHRHLLQLVCNVYSVSVALKPSYLIDCTVLPVSAIDNWLSQLFKKCLACRRLSVLHIEQEVFVVNIEFLLEKLHDMIANRTETALVDVSYSLNSPRLMSVSEQSEIMQLHAKVLR